MKEDSHSGLPLEICNHLDRTLSAERSQNKTGDRVVWACLFAQFLKKNANLWITDEKDTIGHRI